LFGIRDVKLFEYSDSICTALQLTNFYQDVQIDIDKDRIYVPLDELNIFNVTENQYLSKIVDENIFSLMKHQVDRAEQMFLDGMELVYRLPGMLKYEIKWTILGGMKILSLIRLNNYDTFSNRPVLKNTDVLKLIFKSFII
jgi:phytoene/squalene synthetase